MTSRDDDWSHITDINERRKAQNRIAQRNYPQQRWTETGSNSGRNTRSRSPEFFDTSYQPDSTVDFLDVQGLEDFGSPNASTSLDCIDAALNSTNNTPANVPQTAESSTSTPQTQAPNHIQALTPTTNATPLTHPNPTEQPLILPGMNAQPQTHDSPSDAFSCLADFENTVESSRSSTTQSTSDSVSTPSSLKSLTPPSSIASSRSSNFPQDNTIECTPLLSAVMRGNLEIARLLIKSGGKVDGKNRSGKTALHLAVERGDTVATRTLLDLGADITIPDDSGTSVFHRAIIRDDIEQLRGLLKWCDEKSRASPFEQLLKRCLNMRDTQKKTLVHLAVVMERMEILKLLLEYGADVNE
ncbi:ankyrin repeat protein [Colletotrichum karsti]|uniref:Ankyrin repeat protein n=1 Tax=Colletotrichum karsti TaxID=1095194 RepID=A0A9P6I0R9_9PEZI|nr:ankyrin repeat protein [Colletotrichum karsti]KAF9873682.1 ankyrin repeat protein [Colletotrichum karsti]